MTDLGSNVIRIVNLESNLLANSERIDDLVTDLGSNVTRIVNLESNLVANSERIDDLVTDLGSNVTRIVNLESNLVANSERIDDLVTDLGSNVTRIINLESNLVANSERIDDLVTDLGSNVVRIINLESNLVANSERIDDLVTDLGSNVVRIINLESNLVANSERIDDLETYLGSNVTRIVNLESNLVANSERIDDLVTDLGSNVTRIINLESNLVANSERITNLNSNLIANAQRITTLENSMILKAPLLDPVFTNNVTVTGNLTVLGTTTTVDTENLLVKDPIITVSNAAAAVDAGMLINRQDNNVFAGFDTSAGEYTIGFTDNSGLDAAIDIKDNTNFVANVHGNVHANYFIGDGSQLTGVVTSGGGASTLQEVTDLGNVTSNVVQFTNPDTSLVATGDIESKNIRLNDPGITATVAGSTLTVDAANKTYGTGPLVSLGNNIDTLIYSNLINGAQVIIPMLASGNIRYVSNAMSNVNWFAYQSSVEIVQGAHGLLTLSNLYGNIYVNALGLYLPGGGAPDTTDPTGTVGTPTITGGSFTIAVTSISEDNVTVELLSSGGSQLDTSGDLGTTRSYTISHSETSGGTYSYTVRLTDAAGNTTDYAVSGVALLVYETLDFTAVGTETMSITGNLTSTVTMYKSTGGSGWNAGAVETTGFSPPVTVEFDKTATSSSDGTTYAIISWDSDNSIQTGTDGRQFDWAAYPYGTTSDWRVFNDGIQLQATSASWSNIDKKYLVYNTDGSIKHYSGSTLMYSNVEAGTDTRYLRTAFFSSSDVHGAFSNIRVIKFIWDGSAYV